MANSKLILHRKFKGSEYTIGKLYRVSGKSEVYICDILEDTVRNSITTTINRFIKIYGKTAIPYGTYEITRTYSNRFKKILPLLLNVPHYEGIRIHPGNTAADTEGCLLPGLNTVKGKVLESRKHFEVLDKWIEGALSKGKVFITITD